MSDDAADYRAWKAGVTDALDRLRGISASIVPEHVWTRLYIRGMTPEQAASASELQNFFTKDPGERLRK